MAEVIKMPRLSDTMEEGVVAKWLKKVGDPVEEGDMLAEIETDKATMEFESFYSGTLLHIAIEEGQGAPVDSLLAIIGDKNEDISDLISARVSGENKGVDTTSKPKAAQATETSQSVLLPEGLQIITMPRLSDTMTEGTVAKWLKKVGDTIKEGDILAEIETDKATMEFESFHSGTLLYIGVKEGESSPIDTTLAVIGDKNVDITPFLSALDSGTETDKSSEEKSVEQPVKKAAEAKAQKPVHKAEVKKDQQRQGRVFISPLAKKLAQDRNINIDLIKGTGDNGRIIKTDIENFNTLNAVEASTIPSSGIEHTEEVTNSQMRKTIAKRLSESKFTAPHYYLMVEFNMDNAIKFRNCTNDIEGVKISFNDLVLRACALAIDKHSKVNSSWTDAATRIHRHIHLGVAVAIDDGLVVPVLKFADRLSLTQIGTQVKELAKKARDKQLKPEEMSGSTFTVSNLGMFGVQEFTSIINQPNSAILSVGSIVEKPVIKDGKIAIGNTMKLTLACDHRTIDGATGAEFLQTLRGYMENPVSMLI